MNNDDPQALPPNQNSVPGTPPAPDPSISPVPPAGNSVPGAAAPLAKPNTVLKIVMMLAILIAVGAGVFMLLGLRKHVSVQVSCTPVAATAVDKTGAIAEFKTFAQAVKAANQTCADSLSSSYFTQQQAAAFPGSNGKWITMKEGGLASVADRLAALPSTLADSSFTQSNYTRPGSTDVTGVTLAYPLNGANNVRYNLMVSFVAQNGKVLVDSLVLKPLF